MKTHIGIIEMTEQCVIPFLLYVSTSQIDTARPQELIKCARCGQVGTGPCGCGFQNEGAVRNVTYVPKENGRHTRLYTVHITPFLHFSITGWE